MNFELENLELEEQLAAQEELIEKKDQAITDLVEEVDRYKHIAEYMELRGTRRTEEGLA
jgi:uncharacterized coiled-coil protein SlyX